MKKTIKFEIECGEKTCFAEPGKPCRFLMNRRFGTINFCLLWNDEDFKGQKMHMEEEDGWLMRRPECIAATKG